jgi:hypothetical protein
LAAQRFIKKAEFAYSMNRQYVQQAYERIRFYRHEYSDVLPERMVSSLDSNQRYKCRAAWWMLAFGWIKELSNMQILPKDLSDRYDSAFKEYAEHRTIGDGRATPQDIQTANKLLDEVLMVLTGVVGQN